MTNLVMLGVVVSLAAAVRSTWSPCGLSMLSTITPLAEVGRGRRYGWSASWFILGAVLGGAALGTAAALISLLVKAAQWSIDSRMAAIAVLAALAAMCDVRLLGPRLPHHRRQVNEQWLDQFRSWVYGFGFGAQIGCGVATYIMTAGVYLVVLIGALTGNPFAAVSLGVLFGAARGVAILSTSHVHTVPQLASVHRWFEDHERRSRRMMSAVLGIVAMVAGVVAGSTASTAVVATSLVATALVVMSWAVAAFCRGRASRAPMLVMRSAESTSGSRR